MRWFEAITGHERAKEVLARAIERDRVPPALLITGRDGSGRCLLATELAKALNCRGADDRRPCGECVPCRKIASGTHPDFVRVTLDEGKSEISVAQVRALLDELALAPLEGKRRVFVIDPAELLNDFGQDALLKTLEEPPARAHLVLIARHESALARTIQSRCFVLALGELETKDVAKILLARGVVPDEARLRAAWSGGSPGVALRPRHLERIAAARALIDALAGGDARKNPLKVAGDLVASAAPKNAEPSLRREGALEVTDILGRALREALERSVAGDRKGLARCGPDGIGAAIEALQAAEEAIANNQNVNLALEGLVLDISAALGREAPVGRH